MSSNNLLSGNLLSGYLLSGKVAIVTGASSGLGEATVQRFVQEGATVIAFARREDKLRALAEALRDAPGKVIPVKGDVTQRADIDAAVATALAHGGRIDVLVNNAGINDDFAAVGEMDDQLWDDVVQVNLYAPFHFSKRVIPHLIKSKGNIVNIASIGGTEGARSGVAYTASKHALVAMTKHTAFSYAKAGVRCNVICPGAVDTPMVQAAMAGGLQMNEEGRKRAYSGMHNVVRVGESREVANICCFLASEQASLVNGAVIVADAGWTAY